MNRNELISEMASKTEITKTQAELVLKTLLETIAVTIRQKGKMIIKGLGTFTATPRAARKGRNPQTGEEMTIPATVLPGFKTASSLKAILNKEENEADVAV